MHTMKPLLLATPIAIALAFCSCAGRSHTCCGVLRPSCSLASSSFSSSSSSASSSSFVSSSFSLTSPVLSVLQPQSQVLSASSCATIANTVAVAIEPVDVLIKAAIGEPDKMGDCPFSQRVLLTLEEKGIPYKAKFVDITNKPDWFLEINPKAKVPVIKHEGKWVADSDVIIQILEEKFPGPSLQTPSERASVGSKIFPNFVEFLKSKDPSDGLEEALVAELTLLNNELEHNGPYINGEEISATDLSLAPKLYHLQIALGHFKMWSIPNSLTFVKIYITDLHGRESFLKTKPTDKHVIAGWQKHLS